MTAHPRILLTRRWPEAVEQRAAARFEVTLNPDDRPLSEAELAAAMRTHDALCATITDRVTAAVLGIPDRRAGIVASYGVGYEHIDDDPDAPDGFSKTWSFTLESDPDGRLTSGTWLDAEAGHPDFAWVPYSNTEYAGRSENPYLSWTMLKEFLPGLVRK